MKYYPGVWIEPTTNAPFNVLGVPVTSTIVMDGGSLPSGIDATDMSRLVDENNTTQLRVVDFAAPIDLTKTEINTLDVRMDIGLHLLPYAASVWYKRGFDDQFPQFFHLQEAVDCLFRQTPHYPFNAVQLFPGYGSWKWEKTDANPVYVPSGVSDCSNLNLGVQVGTISKTMYKKAVQGIGIMATNLDQLYGWDCWGSDNNFDWTYIDKSFLNSGGWIGGEQYYSSFRGAGGNPVRLLLFSQQQRFIYYKATINNSAYGSDIYKIFTLNLTGDLGYSIDGDKYEYPVGEWLSVGTGETVLPQIGEYAGKFGEYGGVGGAPAVDNYLRSPRQACVYQNYFYVVDHALKCIKVFDLTTQLCLGYIEPPDPLYNFADVKTYLGSIYVHYRNSTGQIIVEQRNTSLPLSVIDTLTIVPDLVVGFMCNLEVDSDFYYLTFTDDRISPPTVIIEKRNRADGSLLASLSKLITDALPIFPTAESRKQGDYLYGYDQGAQVLCAIKLEDLSVHLTSLGWVEGGESYLYSSTSPYLTVADETYCYLSVTVGSVTSLLKLNRTDLSFVDRIHNTNTEDSIVRAVSEDYIYLCHEVRDISANIRYFYKNLSVPNQDKHCIFHRSGLDNFRSFKNYRYYLNPFSNDKRCVTEVYNLQLFNDPRYITIMPSYSQENAETGIISIDNGQAGIVGKHQRFYIKLLQGAINAKCQELQLFSRRDYHDATMSASTVTSPFFLRNDTRRIDEAKYVLNAAKNTLGSLGDTSLVIVDGGTALVNEVPLGGLTNSGDYAVNYQTGGVSFFSGAPGGNCTITFAHAAEGAAALEYKVLSDQSYKHFGIPSGASTVLAQSNHPQTDEIMYLTSFVRSDQSLFAEDLTRNAYLITMITGVFTDLGGAAMAFAMLDYARFTNAKVVHYPDYCLVKSGANAVYADFLYVKGSHYSRHTDFLPVTGPYHIRWFDGVNVRQAIAVKHIDAIKIIQKLTARHIDWVMVRQYPWAVQADILPIIQRESDTQRDVDYDFSKVAGGKNLIVDKRKRS